MGASKSWDLRDLLDAWPFDPDNDARLVSVTGGRQVLQVRTPLGVEQHELDGRPDGARPYGMESALEHFQQQLARARAQGKEADFQLSAEACAELFNEGTLYYFRYHRLFQLQDWARTIRDTSRTLRAFDLIRHYAEDEDDRTYLEQWRPYVLRVHATARAMQELEKNRHQHALEAIKETINQIESLEDLDEDTFQFERERSLTTLRELHDQIERKRPLTALERLERQLEKAIQRQDFERAASLRDKIRELRRQCIC